MGGSRGGSRGGRGVGEGEIERRKERLESGERFGEWEGGDGGRADIGAGKKISTLRESF